MAGGEWWSLPQEGVVPVIREPRGLAEGQPGLPRNVLLHGLREHIKLLQEIFENVVVRFRARGDRSRSLFGGGGDDGEGAEREDGGQEKNQHFLLFDRRSRR